MSQNLLKWLRDFVQAAHDLELPRDMKEGEMPFGTIDYYGMESLLADLDSEIEELEKPWVTAQQKPSGNGGRSVLRGARTPTADSCAVYKTLGVAVCFRFQNPMTVISIRTGSAYDPIWQFSTYR